MIRSRAFDLREVILFALLRHVLRKDQQGWFDTATNQ
jgi:hypothetical protein